MALKDFSRRTVGIAMKYLSESYRSTATKNQMMDDLHNIGIIVDDRYHTDLIRAIAFVSADFIIRSSQTNSINSEEVDKK